MSTTLQFIPSIRGNGHLTAPQPLAQVPALGSIFAAQPVERLVVNQAVFWEGDAAEHVFQVVDGILRLSRTLPDGRRSITGFRYTGDVLGAGFEDRCLCTAEAVTPLKLRRCARKKFQSLVAGSPALGRQLHALLCSELAAAQDHMLLLGRKSALERVASFLLTAASKLPRRAEGRSLVLAMTRQDIADYLGLTIETVSRTITKLRKGGVIALLDAQRILLHNQAELALLAAEGDEHGVAAVGQPMP